MAFVVRLLIFWLTATLGAVASAKEDYEATLDAAVVLPTLIETCELTYQNLTNKNEIDLKVDGDKFYIHMSVGEGSAAGFDGSTFWHQSEGSASRAAFSQAEFKGSKQVDSHPLVAPYLWFFGGAHNAVWSELKSIQRWSEVRSKLRYIETRTISANTCDVFSITTDELKEYHVAFSRELNGFPIQYELILDGSAFVTAAVAETYKDPSGAVIALEIHAIKPGKDPLPVKRVKKASVKINEPVESEIFSLDPTRSLSVRNIDEEPSVPNAIATNYSWTIAMGVIAVCILVGVAVAFMRKRWSI